MIQIVKKMAVLLFFCLLPASALAGCGESGAEIYAGDASSDEAVSDASGDIEDGGEEAAASEETLLYVYVCGEVMEPGVYKLPEGSRICDAVDAAGGMTEDAADSYLNLAELLTDGEKIEVPSVSEAEALEEAAAEEASGLVNINTAGLDELMTLTGIGEAKANAIISYREENGSFASIEELMNISGIKEGVFNQIRDQITV